MQSNNIIYWYCDGISKKLASNSNNFEYFTYCGNNILV